MDDWLLIALISVEMIFDLFAVAWMSGTIAKNKTQAFLDSDQAIPYMDKIANRAMILISPRIEDLKISMSKEIESIRSVVTADLKMMTEGLKHDTATQINAIQSQIIAGINLRLDELDGAIPDFDMGSLSASIRQDLQLAIDGQTAGLKAEILESVRASMNQMQGAIARANAGAMKGIDELIEDAGEGIMQEALEAGGSANMLRATILSQTVPRGYAKSHPVGAMIWNAGKVALVNAVDSGAIPGLSGGNLINKGESVNTARRGPLD